MLLLCLLFTFYILGYININSKINFRFLILSLLDYSLGLPFKKSYKLQ